MLGDLQAGNTAVFFIRYTHNQSLFFQIADDAGDLPLVASGAFYQIFLGGTGGGGNKAQRLEFHASDAVGVLAAELMVAATDAALDVADGVEDVFRERSVHKCDQWLTLST